MTSISVAAVCRRSWKRRRGIPASLSSFWSRRVTVFPWSGSPVSVVKTRSPHSPPCHAGSASSRSESWRERCSRRPAPTGRGSTIVRRLLAVLGSSRWKARSYRCRTRRMLSVLPSMYTSPYRRPRASDWRRPTDTVPLSPASPRVKPTRRRRCARGGRGRGGGGAPAGVPGQHLELVSECQVFEHQVTTRSE